MSGTAYLLERPEPRVWWGCTRLFGFRPRAARFWMWGGPSHLETYDLKPDAPTEHRGPFRPIRPTAPGLDICELFPRSREGPRLRDRYGRHLWGQNCLLARRLAEAGAGVITIDALAPMAGRPVYFSWDDHANAQPGWDLAKGMRWRAPYLDQALSALIEDLYDRGLDRKVLVVAAGEFGRTPRLSRANGCLGRDHWPDAMCALLSGGGLKVGQAVGATTAKGEHPRERPLTPKDLLATIYHHLGIDPRQEFKDFGGRPVAILGEGGRRSGS